MKRRYQMLSFAQYKGKKVTKVLINPNLSFQIEEDGRRYFRIRRRKSYGFTFDWEREPSGCEPSDMKNDLRMFEAWIELAERGFDPRKVRPEETGPFTFGQLAEEWLQTQQTRLGLSGGLRDKKTISNYKSRINKHLAELHCRLISQITPREFADVVRPVWHSDTGRRVAWLGKEICGLAIAKGLRDTDFADKQLLNSLLGQRAYRPTTRRQIPWEQAPTVYGQISSRNTIAARMIRLMMLSCIRVENIVEMEWSWIDFDNNEILIPRDDTKMGLKLFRQPMLATVRETLWTEYERSKKYKFVFHSSRSESGHVSPNVPSKWLREDFNPVYKEYRFQASGLRGTFKTWASETRKNQKYGNDVVEATYMHVKEKNIERHYDQSELFDLKKALLTEWNRYLGAL